MKCRQWSQARVITRGTLVDNRTGATAAGKAPVIWKITMSRGPMSEHEFLRRWRIGVAIGAGVVAAVAALLLAIIGTARSILQNATRALELANEIVENTRAIWALDTTNAVAGQLLDGAEAIETHAGQVADALETPEPAA